MPEDGVGGAVAELVEPVATETSTDAGGESTQSTDKAIDKSGTDDKADGRKAPDGLRKRIADLRRQADSITDPAEKQRLLEDATKLNNSLGKVRAYEGVFPTVREARESNELIQSVGGKDGIVRMQSVVQNAEEIDRALEAGDASIVEKMWAEAPQGMAKIAPAIYDRFAKENPEAYAKDIGRHSIRHLDGSGFPQAFDRMAQLYEAGKIEDAKAIKDELIRWVVGQRSQQTETRQEDPEVKRLREELARRDESDGASKVDTLYSAVNEHGSTTVVREVKGWAGKLSLGASQVTKLASNIWREFQEDRNRNETYKLTVQSKYRQGPDQARDYMNRWTDDNLKEFSDRYIKELYAHQLKNGSTVKRDATAAVTQNNGVQKGKEPNPSEIDYGPKGIQAARKAGFKDIAEMILSGRAPLRSGGIRQWR